MLPEINIEHPNHVVERMVREVPVFYGDPSDPLSTIDHVERFNAHASK